MKKVVWTLICVLVACANIFAQDAPVKDEPANIEQLQWMVGEWQTHEGDLLVGMSARKSENGQAIVYNVWFEKDGKITPQYNGMYYWHPGEKTFKVTQVDRHGTVGEGTYRQEGTHALQFVKTTSATGSMELKSDWEIKPKEFHFVAQFRPAGKTDWAPALEVTYTRLER